MSTPDNPLNKFSSYTVRHVLVAFKYTEDAEKTPITATIGDPGTMITGTAVKGPGVVIANDFTQSEFQIYSAEWTHDFYGPLTETCGSVIGHIEISDRTGMNFVNFMQTMVIPKLGVSEGHIVFALRSFFLGENITEGSQDILVGNPFIFNMVSFVNNLQQDTGRFYLMSVVGAATTYGQLGNLSKIYQMTVTHSDGNLSNEVPIPNVAGSGMLTRKAEDAKQNNARKQRIDKSKPMRTLKEVFSAFEMELNQQKFTHSAQLQSWMQHVNDSYSVKIIPPIQKKNGQIPVDFFVHLDPAYADYPVDNRNLPFEQSDQDQNKKGIRSIPIKTGTDIPVAVEKLMKLSRKVGQECELLPAFLFKTAISVVKKSSDRYQVHIVIRRITVPDNNLKFNTGPGASAINALEYVYQDGDKGDKDIISLTGRITADAGVKVLEQQTQNTNALVVYGDREQITVERQPDIPYFKAQFSGMRATVNPYENSGLESATDAAKIDNSIQVDLKQQAMYSIAITGNSSLLSDLNRAPSDVANGAVGSAQLYKFPELEPLYVKLKIYLKPFAAEGLTPDEQVPEKFYYDNYMFLHRVTNHFEQGKFTQTLDMLRTDGTI
jgi:hypothetical protein